MRRLLQDAAGRAIAYLEGVHSRPVAPSADAVAGMRGWDADLPEQPAPEADVLRLLDEIGSPATMATAGPRFFGFVIGGSLPITVAAQWLAGAWDQNAVLERVTPAAARLEQIALRWLLDLLHLPAGCAGGFATGATMANCTALAAARHAVLKQAGWDVEGQGLFGAPAITVVVGAEIHPSVLKALGLLGLGRTRVQTVAVDGQGRMRADELPPLRGPAIVCTQVGNVNTGACDPVAEICRRVKPSGAWVHVDGAFGLWAAASPAHAHLILGMEAADSWATDAHKWLNVPYDCGLAFVRDAQALRAAMAVTAAYLPAGETRDPSDYAPELSRRARGVEVWAALRSLGRSGVAALIDRTCRHAARFATGLRAAGYDVLNEVVLNQVLVSFGEPAVTDRVIKGIQAEGTCWCGGTLWQGQRAMRISVSSWATTDEDVERSLEAMLRVAKKQP
jgi:glutamate/tyrosine decarboxylase-like PLP-dependent enzyme